MSQFENKLVAIMNKRLDTGIAMNALYHVLVNFSILLTEIFPSGEAWRSK